MSAARNSALVLSLCALALAGCSKSPEEVEASANAHLARNETRSAMVELKDLLQREPNRPQARLLLGRALADQYDYAGAETELRRAAQMGIAADEVAATLARVMLLQGRFEQLVSDEIVAAARAPEVRARALDSKASALLALDRQDDAMQLLEEARKLAPRLGAPSATLAGVLLSRGELDAAGATLTAAAAADPKSAEVERTLGMLRLRERKPEAAVQHFTRATQLAVGPPRDRELQRASLAALIDAQISLQRLAAAEESLARLDGLGRSRVNGLLRTRLSIAKGDLPTARREAEALLAGGRDDPDAALLLGMVHGMLGNTGQAEMQLNEVLAAVPNHFVARQILAQLRPQQGKPREAAAVLEPILKEASGNIVSLAVQANLAAGDRTAALALLEQRAATASEDPQAAAELARGFLLANAPDKALAALPASTSLAASDVAPIEGLRLAALLAKNEIGEARRAADALAARESGNAAIQAMLGDFYLRVGDRKAARAALQRADAAVKTPEPGIALRLAHLDGLDGDLRGAEARLVKAIERNAQAAALHSALADVRAARGDSKAALMALSKAQELAPSDAGLRLKEAQFKLASGDVEGASAATEAAAKQAPTDRAVLRARIATLLQQKNSAEALRVVEQARRDAPADVELGLLQVNVQIAAQQVDAAIETARGLARDNAASIPVRSVLADLLVRKGEVDAARAVGREIVVLDKAHPAPNLIEAEIALREKRFDAAARGIASANASLRNPSLAIREFVVRRDGGLPNPEAPLTQWLKQKPNDVAVTLALAEHRLRRPEDRRSALELYQRVIEREPRNAVALNNAAWASGTLGERAGALELAARAYAVAPQAVAVADTYGWALNLNGEFQKALDVLGKARGTGTALPDLEYHYAEALAGLGRKDEARKVLEAVLAKHSKFEGRDAAMKLQASLR